eukprot:1984334-Amphidinium_carterae.2
MSLFTLTKARRTCSFDSNLYPFGLLLLARGQRLQFIVGPNLNTPGPREVIAGLTMSDSNRTGPTAATTRECVCVSYRVK